MRKLYPILFPIFRFFLWFAHPVFHVSGRENIPEGKCVICCNHSNLSDPLWLLFGLKLKQLPTVMVKKEAMQTPVVGAFLRSLGMIGVDRGNSDVEAIKASLRVLKQDGKLVIFPEGTRVRPGKVVEAKTGAALLASRTDAPLLPVYLTKGKRLLQPLRLVIGAPMTVPREGAKATSPELHAATQALMQTIYALGETS